MIFAPIYEASIEKGNDEKQRKSNEFNYRSINEKHKMRVLEDVLKIYLCYPRMTSSRISPCNLIVVALMRRRLIFLN